MYHCSTCKMSYNDDRFVKDLNTRVPLYFLKGDEHDDVFCSPNCATQHYNKSIEKQEEKN